MEDEKYELDWNLVIGCISVLVLGLAALLIVFGVQGWGIPNPISFGLAVPGRHGENLKY